MVNASLRFKLSNKSLLIIFLVNAIPAIFGAEIILRDWMLSYDFVDVGFGEG